MPQLTWEQSADHKTIYLTFDDGPHPVITNKVLETLNKFNACGTFFCVGENIEKYPETFDALKENQQGIGSHTYNHLNGWATENRVYFKNIKRAALLTRSTLFRPPYGRIKPSQISFIQRHYEIVMWSVLSGDFDTTISPQKCFENVCRHTRNGSIIVFHDSLKSADRLKYALPKTLEHFSRLGYQFLSLPNSREYLLEPRNRMKESI